VCLPDRPAGRRRVVGEGVAGEARCFLRSRVDLGVVVRGPWIAEAVNEHPVGVGSTITVPLRFFKQGGGAAIPGSGGKGRLRQSRRASRPTSR
jgi:hypothetical protein